MTALKGFALSVMMTVLSSSYAFASDQCRELFAPAPSEMQTAESFKGVERYLNSKIVGQPELIEKLLVALLVRGHVLLESFPGLGKTTIARELAKSVAGKNSRIQFRADLMPSDITGSDQIDPKTGTHRFHPGPIFGNIILADEINRGSPKTQSGLLQPMEEGTVTVGETTHPLPENYLVIATENPHDQRGTFPLPDAQLDRFLFKINLDYPSYEDEMRIFSQNVMVRTEDTERLETDLADSQQPLTILTNALIRRARASVQKVEIDAHMTRLILLLVRATRGQVPELLLSSPVLKKGAGPRGSIQLGRAAQARAWLHGRNSVTVEDIKALAPDILSHRTSLSDHHAIDTEVDERGHIRDLIERIIELRI